VALLVEPIMRRHIDERQGVMACHFGRELAGFSGG
jgi:hypothetical protein